jgi:hypothetical protein
LGLSFSLLYVLYHSSVLTKFDLPPSYKFGSLFSIENDCFHKQSNALLNSSVNTAVDFRARLRFPRAVGEPPRHRLRAEKRRGFAQRRVA